MANAIDRNARPNDPARFRRMMDNLPAAVAAAAAASAPSSSVPATAASPGSPGQTAYADGFWYVCVAADTWQRVALATW